MKKHSAMELLPKLKELYPEIDRYELSLDLEYIKDQEYWLVKLEKGHHKLYTHLEVKDADACIDGVQCLYLGVQIGEFVKNFERLEKR